MCIGVSCEGVGVLIQIKVNLPENDEALLQSQPMYVVQIIYKGMSNSVTRLKPYI